MTVDLHGPAGQLEALLEAPTDPPRAAVVLAHAHPQLGGIMRARVLHEVTRGFVRAGAAVLRFNFRGVGLSAGQFDQGEGEVQDFRAALDAMAGRYPDLPLWAAGYSFGAWIAWQAGSADPRVRALIAVAPPLGSYDFAAPDTGGRPVFLVQAEHDEVCPLKQALRFYGRLPEPKEIVVIDAADHLFDGKASEVGDAVEDLVEGLGRTGVSHVRS
jgi:hypothetical protein